MYIDTTFPPEASGRLAQFMRMVDAFERDEIEAAVDALIERLDAADGDPDLETDADDDRCAAGDDGCAVFWLNGRAYWGADDQQGGC